MLGLAVVFLPIRLILPPLDWILRSTGAKLSVLSLIPGVPELLDFPSRVIFPVPVDIVVEPFGKNNPVPLLL